VKSPWVACVLVAACATGARAPVAGEPVDPGPDATAAGRPAAPPAPPAPAPAPAPAPPLGARRGAAPLEPTEDAASLASLRHDLFLGAGDLPPAPALRPQVFPERYTDVEGVLTFRGDPSRTGGAFGRRRVLLGRLQIAWKARTGRGTPPWGGGAGWTGEPVLVRWPEVIRHSIPALRAARPGLVEVVQGSLDGAVYFLDLATGAPTRPPIRTGNPIKGSVSLDPRGYPLLFVGQGIPGERPIGLRAYSLLDGAELFFLPGLDRASRRRWGAFDGSGVVNRETDTFLVGGENGIVYAVELHTAFDPAGPTLALAPRVLRYRYRDAASHRPGIENSLAVHRNLAFFADNGGTIQALDLRTFRPAWAFEAGDDTDASLVVDVERGAPVLYTADEVDVQGARGSARVRRLDGLSGRVAWERAFACRAERGPKKIDAGVFATPLVGKDDLADRIVLALSRCPTRGALVALAKADGRELWRTPLRADAWSSPTAVRDDATGRTYVLQGDRGGRLLLVDGANGRVRHALALDATIEASPAVFDDMVVVATRGGTIYGIRIR
jgi:outer membrane protein assembly factor BamB